MASSYNNTGKKDPSEGLLKETAGQFPLSRRNFIWMIAAGVMIVVGFLLMLGSGSTEEFNPDIFSTRRIVVGPAIAFLGFVAMGIAIIIRPDKNKEKGE